MNDIPRLLPWIGGPANSAGVRYTMEELSQRKFTGMRL